MGGLGELCDSQRQDGISPKWLVGVRKNVLLDHERSVERIEMGKVLCLFINDLNVSAE